jgi:phospholipase/carboxylesterase
MQLPIEWLPAAGPPEQLMLLLHGVGSSGAAMAPLAQALRAEFPQAALLAPDAPQAFDGPGAAAGARQWFSVQGIDETSRVERVQAALPGLLDWIRQTQQRLGVGTAATAIAGFSQGGILALQTALVADGLAGRVLAFGARFAQLPQPPLAAPQATTLHLFHGSADTVIAAQHTRDALQALAALNGDATMDIAEGVGHVLHPALVQRAIFRLRNHIPARTWAAAMGAVPGLPASDHD